MSEIGSHAPCVLIVQNRSDETWVQSVDVDFSTGGATVYRRARMFVRASEVGDDHKLLQFQVTFDSDLVRGFGVEWLAEEFGRQVAIAYASLERKESNE
jgi:hypothetical protein